VEARNGKYTAAASLLFLLAAFALLGGLALGGTAGTEVCTGLYDEDCETPFYWTGFIIGVAAAIQLCLFGLVFLFFAESLAYQASLVRGIESLSAASPRASSTPAPRPVPQGAEPERLNEGDMSPAEFAQIERVYPGSKKEARLWAAATPSEQGWYVDPLDDTLARYFNGTTWTGRRRRRSAN
jgi:hypothetical protein